MFHFHSPTDRPNQPSNGHGGFSGKSHFKQGKIKTCTCGSCSDREGDVTNVRMERGKRSVIDVPQLANNLLFHQETFRAYSEEKTEKKI